MRFARPVTAVVSAAAFAVVATAQGSTSDRAPHRAAAGLGFVRTGRIPGSPSPASSVLLLSAEDGRTTVLLDATRSSEYSDPAWSHDGRYLAVTASDEGPGLHPIYDITVKRGRRTVVQGLSGDGTGNGSPDWSPDDRRLVFAAATCGSRLFIAHLDGRPRPLTQRTSNPDTCALRFYDTTPDWSPDGSRIAFVRDAAAASTASGARLYVIAPNGSNARRLTRIPSFNPSWSPDGEKLAFDDGRRILVIDGDGRRLRRLTSATAGAADRDPAWSPGGSTIAFQRGADIWLMDADGGHERLLIRNGRQPAWKPR